MLTQSKSVSGDAGIRWHCNKRGQWEKQTIGKEEEFTRGSTELGVYVSVLNEPIWLVRNFGFKLSNLMFALSRKSQPRGDLGELVSSV